MERSVAVGSASGVASTVVLAILKTLVSENHLAPLETLQQCLECPPRLDLEDFPPIIFLGGIAVGLVSGPLLDLAWLARQRWRRFIWSQVGEAPVRSLHKVLA